MAFRWIWLCENEAFQQVDSCLMPRGWAWLSMAGLGDHDCRYVSYPINCNQLSCYHHYIIIAKYGILPSLYYFKKHTGLRLWTLCTGCLLYHYPSYGCQMLRHLSSAKVHNDFLRHPRPQILNTSMTNYGPGSSARSHHDHHWVPVTDPIIHNKTIIWGWFPPSNCGSQDVFLHIF